MTVAVHVWASRGKEHEESEESVYATVHTVVLTPLESFPIADLYYPILKM